MTVPEPRYLSEEGHFLINGPEILEALESLPPLDQIQYWQAHVLKHPRLLNTDTVTQWLDRYTARHTSTELDEHARQLGLGDLI